MELTIALAAGAAMVSTAFALFVADRWSATRRRHHLAWAAALGMFAVASFALWAGATETIFAVANAHANDRAEPQYYVSLSSTLLVAWSVSGLVLPALATALTQVAGPRAYMYLAMAVALAYAAFVAYRLTRREAVAEEDQGPYLTITAQLPYSAEVAPHPPDESSRPSP